MQFYLNGYTPGDPDVCAPAPGAETRAAAGLPDAVDVLIVGSGPAGTLLAAQLAAFPGISTGSSSAATARSRWVKQTASPAARLKCSRLSVWVRSPCARPTG